MPRPCYDILAIDLDGTLLNPAGRVSERNREAVRRAREAGLEILPCTGRGLIECQHVLEQIEHDGPVAVAGGALVCEASTGRTLQRFCISRPMVADAARFIHEAGHAALLLKDRDAAGFDYLVVTGPDDHPLDPVSVWWFQALNVTARFAHDLAEDEHPELTVRVGLVADADRSRPIMHALRAHFGPRALLHSFPAVVSADLGHTRGREVHVLEVFDRRAHKWSAIEWFAQTRALFSSRVAALGDHVNDVTMLQAAALGIAMGNAAPEARAAADVVTLSNAEDGVAHAIDRILEGTW